MKTSEENRKVEEAKRSRQPIKDVTRKRKDRKVEEENKAVDKTKNTGRKKKDRKDKKARESGMMTTNDEKMWVVKEFGKLVCCRQQFESLADQRARADYTGVLNRSRLNDLRISLFSESFLGIGRHISSRGPTVNPEQQSEYFVRAPLSLRRQHGISCLKRSTPAAFMLVF